MIAYGVVFVLLLGEIDLSIGYVSGIAAVAVAEFQLPGSGHDFPGWLAILFGLGIVALIGLGQGTIVAKVGVPSFVVTLAGLLIFQGVILKILAVEDSIIIERQLDQLHGDVLLLRQRRLADRSSHHRCLRLRRALRGLRPATSRSLGQRRGWRSRSSPVSRSRASGRSRSATTLRGRRRARRARRSRRTASSRSGCRWRRSSMVDLPRRLDLPRQAHGVRPPRLRRRRQRRGREARRHQRRAHPHHRVHDLRRSWPASAGSSSRRGSSR